MQSLLICISFNIMIKLILNICSLLPLICENTLFLFSKSAMIQFFFLCGYFYVIRFGYIKYYLIKILFPEI